MRWRCSRRADVAARPRLARLALLGAVLAAGGCAGLFQRARPDRLQQYAVSVSGELRVGSAERDITPEVGCYLAGFDPARTSTAVGSPLKVRALVLELGE